jgi:hypothetical protein
MSEARNLKNQGVGEEQFNPFGISCFQPQRFGLRQTTQRGEFQKHGLCFGNIKYPVNGKENQ